MLARLDLKVRNRDRAESKTCYKVGIKIKHDEIDWVTKG